MCARYTGKEEVKKEMWENTEGSLKIVYWIPRKKGRHKKSFKKQDQIIPRFEKN